MDRKIILSVSDGTWGFSGRGLAPGLYRKGILSQKNPLYPAGKSKLECLWGCSQTVGRRTLPTCFSRTLLALSELWPLAFPRMGRDDTALRGGPG